MTDMTWPDLSGWHPLPAGSTIPKGMRYAILYAAGALDVSTASDDFTPAQPQRYRTERPAPVSLPTEEGAKIVAVVDSRFGIHELTRAGSVWRDKTGSIHRDSEIERWTTVEWHER